MDRRRIGELGRERERYGGDQTMMSESLSLCLSIYLSVSQFVCVSTSCPSLSLSLSLNLLLAPIQSVEERGGAGVGRERRGGEERGRGDVERGRERGRDST